MRSILDTCLIIPLFLTALAMPVSAQNNSEELPGANDSQSIGYALGLRIGSDLKQDGVACDIQSLAAGIIDAYQGNPPKMNQQDVQAAMDRFQQQMQQQAQERMSTVGAKNKQEEQLFLAQNKTKPGVVETASGLQYKVLEAGNGNSPTRADTVSCHYKGTLIDGTEFDSSYSRGRPASFPVGGVIAGWTEALQKMKVGAKWQLFVPAKLAYGADPPGPPIEPHSLLVFEVELLGIK